MYTILYYILYIIYYILYIIYYIVYIISYIILYIYEATPEWQPPPQLVLNTSLLLHLLGGWPADFIEVR